MDGSRKHKRRVGVLLVEIVCGALAAFFALLTLLGGCLAIADSAVEGTMRVLPAYERADLTEVLAKEEWTEEDYAFLYKQTGLTKLGLRPYLGDRERLKQFQEALFFEGSLHHVAAAATTQHDELTEDGLRYYAPLAELEAGDVLITSSCHTYGWKNGHAALVLDPSSGTILQSIALGVPSSIDVGGASWFACSPNFLVLRLKDGTAEERAAIAENARGQLAKIPYSITVGILSPKDQCDKGTKPAGETHCSHLVWQAYYNAGIDIDSDGGGLCTCKDIANSPRLEVVQAFGFDLDRLWK